MAALQTNPSSGGDRLRKQQYGSHGQQGEEVNRFSSNSAEEIGLSDLCLSFVSEKERN